jgi:hypothetical protein
MPRRTATVPSPSYRAGSYAVQAASDPYTKAQIAIVHLRVKHAPFKAVSPLVTLQPPPAAPLGRVVAERERPGAVAGDVPFPQLVGHVVRAVVVEVAGAGVVAVPVQVPLDCVRVPGSVGAIN